MAGIFPIYKVIIIGDCGVGKTTLFHRILFGTYIDSTVNNRSTIGLDCFEKTANVLGQQVRVMNIIILDYYDSLRVIFSSISSLCKTEKCNGNRP